ncbi:MAG: hypothetical protein LBK71_07505, partial [Verrucomicrobiales bacterium]|nr:hypothetical protein [Verrucomicrobiales bacterium]
MGNGKFVNINAAVGTQALHDAHTSIVDAPVKQCAADDDFSAGTVSAIARLKHQCRGAQQDIIGKSLCAGDASSNSKANIFIIAGADFNPAAIKDKVALVGKYKRDRIKYIVGRAIMYRCCSGRVHENRIVSGRGHYAIVPIGRGIEVKVLCRSSRVTDPIGISRSRQPATQRQPSQQDNCQSANLPICQSANLPICQSANLPICQSANLPICQSAN